MPDVRAGRAGGFGDAEAAAARGWRFRRAARRIQVHRLGAQAEAFLLQRLDHAHAAAGHAQVVVGAAFAAEQAAEVAGRDHVRVPGHARTQFAQQQEQRFLVVLDRLPPLRRRSIRRDRGRTERGEVHDAGDGRIRRERGAPLQQGVFIGERLRFDDGDFDGAKRQHLP